MRKYMILKAAAAVFATLAIIGSLEQARPDFMYWNEFLQDGSILRANLDGTGLTTLVSGVNNPSSLTLDVPGGKIYLSDRTGVISRYNLDGSGRETILTGLSNNVRRMALDIPRGKIYWAEIGGIR